MRIRQHEALDLRAILMAAHREIDDVNSPHLELWNAILTDTFSPHFSTSRTRHVWRASELGGCARANILKLNKENKEEPTVEALNNFALGKLYHALVQFGMHLIPEYSDVQIEVGGDHPILPLTARGDILYRHEERGYPVEFKTESSWQAKERREKDFAANPAHVKQLAATAMVEEEVVAQYDDLEEGWIVYINKESGDCDPRLIPLGPELRTEVKDEIFELETWRGSFEATGTLPPLLPMVEREDKKNGGTYMATPGICAPRGANDKRGKYCPVRRACMAAAAREINPNQEEAL